MSLPTPTELVTPPTPDPVRPIERTQATPPSSSPVFDETGRISNLRRNEETGELFDPGPHAYQQPGVGAVSDDAGNPTLSKNFSEANFAYNNLIQPQPNILDDYASYTYNLSLFLLTPQQVQDLFAFGKANTASWNLLMASGGAGNSKRDQAPNGAPVGRNKYFTNDFYIDNFVMKTALTGSGSGASVGVTDLSFSIFEPNGITLIPLMSQAWNDMMKNGNYDTGPGVANLATAPFCMLITFYGYDETGRLVKVGKSGTAPTKTINTDTQAIVEKYVVFNIATLKFKVASRGFTEYVASGKPMMAPTLDTNRGLVKASGVLIGETLGDILSGPATRNNAGTQGERIDSPAIPTPYSSAPDASTARESVEGYSNLY